MVAGIRYVAIPAGIPGRSGRFPAREECQECARWDQAHGATLPQHGVTALQSKRLVLQLVCAADDRAHGVGVVEELRGVDAERRPITTSADGFHVGQSQGFIRLEQCEFSLMRDDCIAAPQAIDPIDAEASLAARWAERGATWCFAAFSSGMKAGVESNGVECQSTIGENGVVLAVASRLETLQRLELSLG